MKATAPPAEVAVNVGVTAVVAPSTGDVTVGATLGDAHRDGVRLDRVAVQRSCNRRQRLNGPLFARPHVDQVIDAVPEVRGHGSPERARVDVELDPWPSTWPRTRASPATVVASVGEVTVGVVVGGTAKAGLAARPHVATTVTHASRAPRDIPFIEFSRPFPEQRLLLRVAPAKVLLFMVDESRGETPRRTIVSVPWCELRRPVARAGMPRPAQAEESGRRESNPRSQLGKLMFCR